MGQQQILFLILGVCIVGIAVSVGLINLQGPSVDDNRGAIVEELQQLGAKAQLYYKRPFDEGGGGGSFLRVNLLPNGIETIGGERSTPHGEYLIKRNGHFSRTQIFAVGTTGGINPALPVRVVMTVWADRTQIVVLN